MESIIDDITDFISEKLNELMDFLVEEDEEEC